MKILCLEGLHPVVIETFKRENYEIIEMNGSLSEDDLINIIGDIDIIGIRSKTKITKRVMEKGRNLQVIGCFCIGTDQVDLEEAEKRGIAVFNSPFANSRSVAELVIAEIISLSRKLTDVNRDIHNGIWNKSSLGCNEIRGKTLGIIGYGHVGSQVSLLAESFSMNVVFYDIEHKMPLGNALPLDSLDHLLSISDYVTLHVPSTEQTKNIITSRELNIMKKGSYLLNLSRGNVVNLQDISHSLRNKHLAGCAIDVYPFEPEKNGSGFSTILQNYPNTILTPHIGGSTIEAQEAIGKEVSQKLIKYIKEGNTTGCVNLPQITLPKCLNNNFRLLNIHYNHPCVLKSINDLLQEHNITGQWLETTSKIGYLIIQVDDFISPHIISQIINLSSSIKTRLLSS